MDLCLLCHFMVREKQNNFYGRKRLDKILLWDKVVFLASLWTKIVGGFLQVSLGDVQGNNWNNILMMALMNKIGNVLRQRSGKLPCSESSTPNALLYQAIRCFSSKLFIGGLSYTIDENSLREAFTPYGDVIEARIIVDRESGRSRGFGFVSYTSAEEASAAIQALDGRDLHGRFIRVAYASDKRGTNTGPCFSGGAGYGGASNYGSGSGYNDYGNIGTGSTGGYGGNSYGNHNIGTSEGVASHGNWCAQENGTGNIVNVGPDSNYGNQAFTNTTSGTYGYNARDNIDKGCLE